ncbi:MAG: LamG-like jellyroll fold domain-containing protein [Bryobacteraceae bacterium]|nr:LamG-like jellyroll fold domain-containing protein [Bryobacteraceae bacterium]
MLAICAASGLAWTARFLFAQNAPGVTAVALETGFDQQVQPFLKKNCVTCHNADNPTAGIRVDQLDARLEDRHIRVWEGMRHRLSEGTMPPKGLPQPSAAERQQMVQWIGRALDVARLRPAPKNGTVRRLTVAQYRNTLHELLLLDDDLTEGLPPEAVSKDGFLNNKETLQLSPLLLESYLDIAEDALSRAIVEPRAKPFIQNFRMDLGAGINPSPLAEELILGANSLLLKNKDFTVTQLTPGKPFPFEPYRMQTSYRFIEGYAGNDTVRGWREYESIYHSVFACMRGSRGYPKGLPYSTVPQGLLLRPSIPNDELFQADGTYGPKANFKISLRELPDNGRFRVTVTAARYDDGLLLDSGAPAQNPASIIAASPNKAQTVTVAKAGVYQVDLHSAARVVVPPVTSRLTEGLTGNWSFDGPPPPSGKLADSPFGKALTFARDADSVTIPRDASMDIGAGDFTAAMWIRTPTGPLRREGILSLGGPNNTHGWFLDMPDNKGVLRLETAGPDNKANGSVSSPGGTIRPGAWQHIAVVARRGQKEAQLFVNGYVVAKGEIGPASLDNPSADLQLGRTPDGRPFRGDIDEVRIYRRALDEGEVQGLIEPGRQLVRPPPEKPLEITLNLGGREFSGTLKQPAFLAVRLPAGPLKVQADHVGFYGLDRLVLTPLAADEEAAKRFVAFEKRNPRIGVHLGLRRDCGSTLAPAGPPQTVAGSTLRKFVFEGAIRNFPSPDVEKDNVNYLAGVREIGVRSEYTDGRDMPRLLIRSVEFEGPFYESWPPPSHRNIFSDFERKDDASAYARHILHNFATRAYRRPVTAAEEASLLSVYRKSTAAGRDFQTSVKDALQVALTSPQFLLLIEKSTTAEPEPLDDYELSSKLSYFLWNGPPDRTTLRLAATGTLRSKLDAEVARMVADPRFSRFTGEFASQWLSLDKFSVLEPDRTFPESDP